ELWSISSYTKASICFTLASSRPASSAMLMRPRITSRVSGSSGASFSSDQNSGLIERILGIRAHPLSRRRPPRRIVPRHELGHVHAHQRRGDLRADAVADHAHLLGLREPPAVSAAVDHVAVREALRAVQLARL